VYHISYFTKIAICHPLDGRLDRTCPLVGQQGLRAPQIKIKGFYQKKTSTALINTSLPIFIPSKFISIVDIKREKIRGPNPINPTSAKSSRLFFHPQRKLPPSSTLSPPAHPPCCSTLSPPLPPPIPGLPLSVQVVLHEFRREIRGVLLQPVSGGGGAAVGEGAQL
jgi:hypothetical protein